MSKILLKNKIYNNKFIIKIRNTKQFSIQIHKSIKNIYIQLMDKNYKNIIFSISSINNFIKNKYIIENKKIMSEFVGNEFAKYIKYKNITNLSFNKKKYKYHGRLKYLADKIRLSGVKI